MVERPTPSLLNDPSVVFLTGLLADVHAGQIQLPRFQRRAVWTLEQRLDLLDSVASGIPIGAVMLWRTQRELAVHGYVGPHAVPVGRAFISQYVIDGGQRLASLYGALYPLVSDQLPEGVDEPPENFQVHYDLNEERFVTPSPGEAPPAHWLPLPAVLDTVPLLRFQRALRGPSADEHMGRADEVAKRFRAYKVPLLVLASDDLELATKTFKRVNSTGTPMSEPDMVSALVWTESFDLHDALKAIREERLAPYGWQDVENDILLRSVKVVLGFDLYEGAEDVSAAIKKHPECISRTADALERVASFLRDRCGICGPGLVPYSHQIPLLVRAFDINPTPDDRLSDRLVAWLWLTTYAEIFASMSGYRLGLVTDGIDQLARTGRLTWTAAKAFSRRPLPARFDFRHARSRALALRLADLKEGGARELAEYGVSTVSKLIQRGPGSDSPGNRFLVTPAQRAELIEKLTAGDPAACRTHAVSEVAQALLRTRQLREFVAQRATDLDELEASFVMRWASFLDGPPATSGSPQLDLLSGSSAHSGPYISYLRRLSQTDLEAEIERCISETQDQIIESDAFASSVAETNASGFILDEVDIQDVELGDLECIVTLGYSASGEQHEERMHAGDKIRGEAVAVIDGHRSVTYREVTAEIDYGDR